MTRPTRTRLLEVLNCRNTDIERGAISDEISVTEMGKIIHTFGIVLVREDRFRAGDNGTNMCMRWFGVSWSGHIETAYSSSEHFVKFHGIKARRQRWFHGLEAVCGLMTQQ